MINENNLVPSNFEKTVPKGKILVLAPHPDDEVFGCGGAVIRHLQQGDEVKVVIVTDGGFPVNESQKTNDYPEIRKRESLAAANILGYGHPQFLDFKDGFLKADEELINRLLEIIHEFHPQNIYLPSETEIHPDHIALNKAGIEAAKRFPGSINLFFYEIGQPLRPNFFLDITVLQPTLEEAMDCFVSQLAVQDYKTHIRSLHAYRSYTLGKDVKFAEAYRVVKSDELKTGEELWLEKRKTISDLPLRVNSPDGFPLISVIVRTMNRPELPEALESISLQTYPNLEVIVVDARGEMPLNLGECCGNFPLHLISKNNPLNRPEAANAGLDAVRGEYFCFLDEDDLLEKTHIEKLFLLLKQVKALAAYSGIKVVDKNDSLIMNLNGIFVKEKLLWENFIPIHALLFKDEVIKRQCRFDDKFEVFEDWDFLLQVAYYGKFIHHNEITGTYRNSDASGVLKKSEEVISFRKSILNKWKNKLNADEYYKFICYLAENNLLNKTDYETYLSEHQKVIELGKLVAELNKVISAITRSTSWKFTAPFRKISQALKSQKNT